MWSSRPKFSAASGFEVVTMFQPARPPLRCVERGEAARHVIGLVEGGRSRCDQADALGDGRQRRQQRERLERGHGVAALERIDRHVQHGEVIGHEEGVELAGLELLDQRLDVAEVEIGVRPGPGIAPGAGVDADRAHERAKLELPLCHRAQNPVLVSLGEDIGTPGNSAIGGSGKIFLFFAAPQHNRVIRGAAGERALEPIHRSARPSHDP